MDPKEQSDLDIAQAFDAAFEEMEDDVPGTWDQPDDVDEEGAPVAEPESDEDDDEGSQSGVETRADQTEPGQKKSQAEIAKESIRPWAGRFKTPEEMEQHLLSLERGDKQQVGGGEQSQPQQQGRPQDPIVDLTADELTLLSEHDEADGTKHFQDYFRHKMRVRDLSESEVKAIREHDEVNGTDLYGDYREARTERRLMDKFAPVLKPLAERNEAERQRMFQTRELEIDKGTADEFGNEFENLRKQSTDVKFIEKVLNSSPMTQVILDAQQKSPATAHRLLLREIQRYNAASAERTRAEKGKKSVPADIGGSGKANQKKLKAQSVEEAWDASVEEQG